MFLTHVAEPTKKNKGVHISHREKDWLKTGCVMISKLSGTGERKCNRRDVFFHI